MDWTKRTKGLYTAKFAGCFAMVFRAPGLYQRWAWEVRLGSETASGVVNYRREARAACWAWVYQRVRQIERDLADTPGGAA